MSALPDLVSDERGPLSKLVLPPLLRLLLLLLLPLPAPLLLLLFSFGISTWRLSGAGQLTWASLSTIITHMKGKEPRRERLRRLYIFAQICWDIGRLSGCPSPSPFISDGWLTSVYRRRNHFSASSAISFMQKMSTWLQMLITMTKMMPIKMTLFRFFFQPIIMAFKSDVSIVIFATRENDYENGEDLHIMVFLMSMIYEKDRYVCELGFFSLFYYFIIYMNHGYLKLWNLCLSLSLKDCWAAYGKYFRDRDIHIYFQNFKLCSLKSLWHARFFPADPNTLRSSLVSSPGSADFDSLFLKRFHKNLLPLLRDNIEESQGLPT